MSSVIEISGRKIGEGYPLFIVAEMSANHNQSFDEAVKIIHAAKDCRADAIKLQTYTPDTITIDSNNEYFKIKGTIWEGETLYNLYKKAFTPWDWQPKLKKIADDIGIIFFSTPFDKTSVDFLEKMNVPAYKIASFELVDIPLIEYVASKDKPLIMSTGMANLGEIEDAVAVAKNAGAKDIALLKCTSAYPTPPEEMNLKTISDMSERFKVPIGVSDHTLGIAVPVAAVALGACIIEKHFTLSRSRSGPDSSFSLEPDEFKSMVQAVRTAEKALGKINYEITEKESESRVFRRSLFVVQDVKAGDSVNMSNVRSIRPGYGLPPKYLNEIIEKCFQEDVKKGTPLSWDLISE